MLEEGEEGHGIFSMRAYMLPLATLLGASAIDQVCVLAHLNLEKTAKDVFSVLSVW